MSKFNLVYLSIQVCLLLSILELILCQQELKLYVTTSVNTQPCPGTWLCATLTQIAANSSVYLLPATSITLVFQQGQHRLDAELVLGDVEDLLITSDNSEFKNATTDLNVKSARFYGLRYLRISGVNFTGSITIESVKKFLLEDSTIQESNKTALKLFNTTADIIRSSFKFNSFGTYRGLVQTLRGKVRAASGGAVLISQSNATILNSSFEGNQAEIGGAVFVERHSQVLVLKSNFIGNKATTGGGALYSVGGSNVTIADSTFHNNIANNGFGGALGLCKSVTLISHCNFSQNMAGSVGGGAITSAFGTNLIISNYSIFSYNTAKGDYNGGVMKIVESTVAISSSTFKNNNHSGVILGQDSMISISSSDFDNNTGGVVKTRQAKINARDSLFTRNSANESWYGGVMWLSGTNISITNCTFVDNTAFKGGVLEVGGTDLNIAQSKFYRNYAFWGGVLRVLAGSSLTTEGHNIVEDNSGYQGIVHFQKSSGIFSGIIDFVSNKGSLIAHDSSVTFKANTLFVGGSQLKTDETVIYREGGAITAFQSSIFIDGTCIIRNNSAEDGGAMYTTQSKVNVLGMVTIANNMASKSGGGIYLYQSELNCQGQSSLTLEGNNANQKGGGIHIINSLVKVNSNSSSGHYTGSAVRFIQNTATRGGGIYVELSSRFHILRHNSRSLSFSNKPQYVVHFDNNIANFGGALYVADDTNPGTCASVSYRTYSPATECFLQTLALLGKSTLKILNIKFTKNHARVSGHSLYGGLFDRCTVSPFSETFEEHIFHEEHKNLAGLPDGVAYLSLVSNIRIYQEISSEPILLQFCRDGEPDPSYQGPSIVVNPGDTISMSIAALDQVNHTVSATVRSSLYSHTSGLGEGQLVQNLAQNCTNVTFTIFSLQKFEELIIYAEGPCKDANKSKLRLPIQLSPCKCPIGFQIKHTKRATCECECDLALFPHITKCNPQTGTLTRESNFWITNISVAGYVFHPNCPFDYCYPASSSIEINLNTQGGADAQCEFNRSGKLCGRCKPGLSLSISSPQCLSCLTHWPAVCVVLVLVALILGIALVALLLVLNVTVAVGTINGLVFYANIIYANNNVYFPLGQPKIITVFIAWLNLDLGIDSCFFQGMDAYWKTWLQFAFPTYIVILVVAVIAASKWSSKFSQFLGKMNPVATLATLILLSYAKFLHAIILALSFTILHYPDGSDEVVWLPDATVQYFLGKHSALLITAFIVLIVCIAYTILIFSWQWLLHLQDKRCFKWLSNSKLGLFIECYHVPYTPHHRYWTGLLLLVRLSVLLTSAVNVSGNSSINLLVTGIMVSFLLFLKGFFGNIYRNRLLGSLEVACYLNIVLFSFIGLFSLKNGGNQIAAAYISGFVTIALTLVVLVYHIFTQVINKLNLWKQMKGSLTQRVSEWTANEGTNGMELTSTQSLLTSTIVDAPRHSESVYNQFREELLD